MLFPYRRICTHSYFGADVRAHHILSVGSMCLMLDRTSSPKVSEQRTGRVGRIRRGCCTQIKLQDRWSIFCRSQKHKTKGLSQRSSGWFKIFTLTLMNCVNSTVFDKDYCVTCKNQQVTRQYIYLHIRIHAIMTSHVTFACFYMCLHVYTHWYEAVGTVHTALCLINIDSSYVAHITWHSQWVCDMTIQSFINTEII